MPQSDEMDLDSDQEHRSNSVVQQDSREKELDEKYPHRPQNHSETLLFHTLSDDLFDPLIANLNKKGPSTLPARRRIGPHSGNSQKPTEIRRAIIERYISRWRKEVGDDVFPFFRLIMPDKDRERAMYGIKEKALGRFLVKVMKIDKNSPDAIKLVHWKVPGQDNNAGDFPARCLEVLKKRPYRVEPGMLTIGDVNEMLDQLSGTQKEEVQLPIMDRFYREMNPEEMLWLIRIILRSMKMGATEKTFMHVWHPDAEALFNVSSSLRRVCWDLHNPKTRLESEDRGVKIMQCFQPQLAGFQEKTFDKLVAKMKPTDEDPDFWIEEKLDGERMQLHMISDEKKAGGKTFKFWSRKAKEYTYLYGDGLYDENSALTRHLKDAFADGVDNIILDGEMITWDPETDKAVAFGTLKTAALAEQRNPFTTGQRPLFRIFDILYLNNQPLTRYTLRDRRKALEASVKPVERRFEIHKYVVAKKPEEIEPLLRQIVADASEGLVVKNPRSSYILDARNDDWIKVKPEYMEEFGESLDCLIIGGYYGSGRRGGILSSFLCGLRADDDSSQKATKKPQKFYSFFKVGGGLTANDYANIRHHTENKWIKWNPKNPPTETIVLGGGLLQREMPDVWIKPEDSLVVQTKAAAVTQSDDFALDITLRFPRFQRLRADRDWQTALSQQDFLDIREKAEKQQKVNEMRLAASRKRQAGRAKKKPLVVAGYNAASVNAILTYDGNRTKVFHKYTMFIMTESTKPEKKSKTELEEMVKAHGGHIVQSADAVKDTEVICIAERRTVKVASLIKQDIVPILKPIWLFDCITQARIDFSKALTELPLRPEADRHVFFSPDERRAVYDGQADQYDDSYARDTTVEELKELLSHMKDVAVPSNTNLQSELGLDLDENDPTSIFAGCRLYFDPLPEQTDSATPSQEHNLIRAFRTTAKFAGASVIEDLGDKSITHVIVIPDKSDLKPIRQTISQRKKVPRVVTMDWVKESWWERTRLDEERFAAPAS